MRKKKHAAEYDEVEALLESCRTQERAYIESIRERDLQVVRRILAESLQGSPAPRRAVPLKTLLPVAAAGALVLGLLGYAVLRFGFVGSQVHPPVAREKPAGGTPSSDAADSTARITKVSAIDPPRRGGHGGTAPTATALTEGIHAFPVPPAAPPEHGPVEPAWTITSDLPIGHVKITLSGPTAAGAVLTAHVAAAASTGGTCTWTASAGGRQLADHTKHAGTLSFPITRTTESITIGIKRHGPSGTCTVTGLHIAPDAPPSAHDRHATPGPPTATPTPALSGSPHPAGSPDDSPETPPAGPGSGEPTTSDSPTPVPTVPATSAPHSSRKVD